MKDDQKSFEVLAKIIQQYPELYDSTHERYGQRFYVEDAWGAVASAVSEQLADECTVEEIKTKWRGMRSSYNRYKHKLQVGDGKSRKAYYLYDTLRFLDNFIKWRGDAKDSSRISSEISNEELSYDAIDTSMDKEIAVVKQEPRLHAVSILEEPVVESSFENVNERFEKGSQKEPKKRKCPIDSDDVDNENMNFFKSILPDIRGFTNKEMRALKIRILQVIDEIEESRKLSTSLENNV